MPARKPFCFVSMADGPDSKSLYERAVRPALSAVGVEAISFYDNHSPEEFDRRLRKLIYQSNVMVANIDDLNPNVVYEVGVAIGLGKPVILVVGKARLGDLPSMMRARACVVLDDAESALEAEYYDRARDHIRKFVDAALRGSYIERRFQQHTHVILGSALPTVPSRSSGCTSSKDLRGAGIAAYELGAFAEAIELLSKALRDGDRHYDTYFYLADAHFLRGEGLPEGQERAQEYMSMQSVSKEGYDAHPEHLVIAKSYGLACLKVGNLLQAESVFQALLRQQPDYTVARYNLACVYAVQRSRSMMMQTLRQVFESNPEFRFLARLDSDFDAYWNDELFQRLLFPAGT